MRKLINCCLIFATFCLPAAGQDAAEDQSCAGALVVTVDPAGSTTSCGFALETDGTSAQFDEDTSTDPCSYYAYLGLESPAMCQPTIGGEPKPVPRPQTGPCDQGMCPPSVGLGGTMDPLTGSDLIKTLPDFGSLKIQAIE